MISSIEAARVLSQRDLAEMFHVSQVTVSRALRGTGQVEPKLEAALRKAAREQGYSPEAQFHARALRQRRQGGATATNVICAIVRDAGEGANHFNMRLLRGIEQGAEEVGNELIVAPRARFRQHPRVVARRQVDGVVWLMSDMDLEANEPSCPVPMVSVLFPVPNADLVATNDRDAMRAMGERLAQSGHRRVAFVGPDSVLARARLDGLREGVKGAGGSVCAGDVQLRRFAMNEDTTLSLTHALMDRRQAQPESKRVTAIAVYNDYMALFVIRCIQKEYGLRVPHDLSVTGFDGVEIAGAPSLRLTTAAIPLEQLGAEAARTIAWRMQYPKAPLRRVVLDARLVEGETVGEATASE